MNLGRRLFLRFTDESRSPRLKKPSKKLRAKGVGKSARRIGALDFARGAKTPKKKRVRSETVVEVAVAPKPNVPAARSMEPESAKTLTTAALVSPDSAFRASVGSFLLDLRSPHTRRAYGKDLQRFVKYLVARKFTHGPEAITRAVIIGYKDALLAEKLEHTTIDRHLSTLRSFFRWLVDDDIIAKNPAEGVRYLNAKRLSRTNGFTDEEVVRVLAKPNLHTRTGSQHYAILMVLFYCGLRRSELCELRNASLGEERGHHVLRLRGKGNSERVIVVVPAVMNAIRHYFRIARKDPSRDEPLFSPVRNNRSGTTAKPFDPSMIFYVVKRYAKLAGIANRVSPHSCRATAISNARDHNVPDRAIQEFAGWASPDMITRYDKRKNAVENSAARAIRYAERARDLPWVSEDEE